VLTPQESESLVATLAQMVARGLSIVFISHKLDEVMRVCDRVAVLRGGRLVMERPRAQVRKADLAEAMVGRPVAPAARHAAAGTGSPGASPAPVARLSLRGAAVRGDGPRPLLDQVDLQLHAGEVVAIAGVAGNGQQALAEVLCGERALDAGALEVDGHALPARPAAFVAAGVARIPEDRHEVGVVGDLPLWENAVLERVATPAFSRLGVLRRGAAREHAQRILQRFDVRGTEAGGVDTVTRGLSGGNMQKLILGRALTVPAADGAPAAVPPVIVANQPTWGLDVGAVAYVHQQLLDACAAGSAVLLVSEDLDEIFALADRIAVMHHGRLTQARAAAGWTLASIGLAMAGGAAADAPPSPGGAAPPGPAPEASHAP
jgi:simple sugar transport system ATP-binding protein